jgi:predicted XRE-type DNA-binding protein
MAAMRLARRGVDLDRHLETARALLGDPLWEIVRVDRPSASNLVAGGISTGELDSMIERLERL